MSTNRPPKRLCIAFGPGCDNAGIAAAGTSRCPAHSRGWRKSAAMKSRSGYYDTRSWKERRARQLAEEPYCRTCGRPAEIADHVFNVGAGHDFDGPLQSLCKPCHAKKTASEGGKASKQKRRRSR